MNKQLKFFIVDDDPGHAKLLTKILERAGHVVYHTTSSVSAITEIMEHKPDCVLLDIMMPEIDGLELCKRLRSDPSLDAMKIVMVSGKAYEFDRKRAFDFGANGYIIKPVGPKEFTDQIQKIVEDRIELTFWGTRGTMPVSGEQTIRYGGNTSCVSLDFPKGNFFIFDAGTGIKVLSDHLMAEKRLEMEAKIFISHPHWDHINALPFFVPMYIQGNEFEICGPSHGDITMRELISAQMDGVYFPIRIKEFAARVYFRDLKEEELEIDGIKIKTMLLNHPGYCLGYRVDYNSRSVCYITDNELYPRSNRFFDENYVNKLADFVKDADVLITDCAYNDQEYESKVGWGHSSIGQVVDLADTAKVKSLHLFHHDPGQADAEIESKLETAREMLENMGSSTTCVAPMEKQLFKV